MMKNRYGADKLSLIMIIASIVLTVIAALIDASNAVMIIILLLLSAALLIYSGIRIFSKDIKKRMNELHMLEILEFKIKSMFEKDGKDEQPQDDADNDTQAESEAQNPKEQKADDVENEKEKEQAEFRYFKCPKCKKRLKVPAGKGYVHVMCPVCSYKFMKHT